MLRHCQIFATLAIALNAPITTAMTLEQAINLAEQEGKGQAIGFYQINHLDKALIAVQLMSEDGIKHIFIDPETAMTTPQSPSATPILNLRQALALAEKEGKVIAIEYRELNIHGNSFHRTNSLYKSANSEQQTAPYEEKKSAVYFLTIEKDGKVQHKIISAIDGSPIKLPLRSTPIIKYTAQPYPKTDALSTEK